MPKIFIVSDNIFFKLAIQEIVNYQFPLIKTVPVDIKTYENRKLRTSFLGITILDGTIHSGNGLNEIYSFISKINSRKIVIKGNISELVLSSIFMGAPDITIIDNKIKEIESVVRNIFKNHRESLQSVCSDTECFCKLDESYSFYITYCLSHDLTSTEMKVLYLSLTSHKISEISATMNLRSKSISSYKSRALKKLGLSNTPANLSSLSTLFNFKKQ